MNLTFNIVYIRDTVEALAPLALTLLRSSDCDFRLVSNACTPQEEDLLQSVVARSRRLSFHRLDTASVMHQGRALTALEKLNRDSEFFAFLDSDILASGPFLAELVPLLEQFDAVFSGAPIWALESEQVLTPDHATVSGPHNRTHAGLCIGSSYFGIYRRASLKQVMSYCGTTFEKYTLERMLSCASPFVDFMQGEGLVRTEYEPPKLLNMAFQFMKFPIVYREVECLHHIGGFSISEFARALEADDSRTLTAEQREIVAYPDHRPYMQRKRLVCQRLSASFRQILDGRVLERRPALTGVLEERIRLLERLYAEEVHRTGLLRIRCGD